MRTIVYKGIQRRKSDDQPGKTRKDPRGRLYVIPARGRKYRNPRQAPGLPMGKPVRKEARS